MKIKQASYIVKQGNISANYESAILEIQKAKREEVDMLILPPMALTGVLLGERWFDKGFLTDAMQSLEKLAMHAEGVTIALTHINTKTNLPLRSHVPLHHSFFILQDKSIKITYPLALPKTGMLSLETPYFESVQKNTSSIEFTHNQNIYALYPYISREDIKSIPCETPCPQKYAGQIFLHMDIEAYDRDKTFSFTTDCIENKNLHIYQGMQGVAQFGKTLLIFPGIEACASSNSYYESPTCPKEGLLYSWIANDNTCHILSGMNKSNSHLSPSIPSRSPSKEDAIPYENLFHMITHGLKLILNEMKITKVLIGISGGIDSALNAALYTYVLGSHNVFLISMPSQYNSSLTQSLAKELACNLNCPFTTVSIQDGVNQAIEAINQIVFKDTTGTSHPVKLSSLNIENMQARERSSRILSAISSAIGAPFTCNGNRTELAAGYATLYGDLSGFLAATADLMKCEVYGLANYINHCQFDKPVIPEGIINIKPSAELSPKQDASQGLGDPIIYEYHDFLFRALTAHENQLCPEEILGAYLEGNLENLLSLPISIDKVFSNGKSFVEDFEYWYRLVKGFAIIKRYQAPPLLSLSHTSFAAPYTESPLPPYFSHAYNVLKEKILKPSLT